MIRRAIDSFVDIEESETYLLVEVIDAVGKLASTEIWLIEESTDPVPPVNIGSESHVLIARGAVNNAVKIYDEFKLMQKGYELPQDTLSHRMKTGYSSDLTEAGRIRFLPRNRY